MRKKFCCNPFDEPSSHSKSESDLRPVPAAYSWKIPGIDTTSLMCTNCRKKLKSYLPPKADDSLQESQPLSNKPSSEGSTAGSFAEETSVDFLLGVSPVKRKRSCNKSYMGSKLSEMQEIVRKKFKSEFHVSPVTEADKTQGDHETIVHNLRKDVQLADRRQKKIDLLSLLPNSWPNKKIAKFFNVTEKTACSAKLLRLDKENEKMGKENPRGRPSLDPSIKKRITEFYLDDENSRQLPGIRDCISVVQEDGKRKLMQKRLILCNLQELHEKYKMKYPEDNCGLSTFCLLRPKQCVLAGSSGTHTVCVCMIHENVSLMLEGCKFKKIFKNSLLFGEEDVSSKVLLRKMVCSNPTMACYERTCTLCPPLDEIRQHFIDVFEENDIEEVDYRMWTMTDRCTILNVRQDADEFLDTLMESLQKLLLHDFVSMKQAKYFSSSKETLKEGHFVVVFDFAENCTFLAQRAVPGFHWNNEQATLFPVTVYFVKNGSLHHRSYAFISDCLKHDSIAVYMFQKKLIEILKRDFGELVKIIYFSDGAPQQFKNRKAFSNLCYHFSDFGIEAEWHFFATAHGKGPCDGLAGCIKRMAVRASLQGQQILNAMQLYEWAKGAIKNVHFYFLSIDAYEKTREFLEEERFAFSKAIKGTKNYHAFIPVKDSLGLLTVKTVSDAADGEVAKALKKI